MESKWSLSPPKPEKKTRKKKNSRQSSQQCLTEPTQPHKDTLRSTEQTLSNTESPSVQGTQVTQQDELLTKEASAVDYLRDLSEDESNQLGLNSNVAPLEEEVDPVDTSDRLSPFNDPKKKKKQPAEKPVKEKKPVQVPTTNMNIQHVQSKVARDIYRPREEIPGDVRKRVRSEPNETVRTLKAMQGKSYQFVYPKFLAKGVSSKVNFATTYQEDENNNQYDIKIEERMTQKEFRSAENHGLHHIHNRVNTKEEESGIKLPSVLQIKKLVGCSYSQLLQNMKDPQATFTEIQLNTQENDTANHLVTNRLPLRKAFSPGEKKLFDSKQPSQQQQAVLVGRSLSVPKIPQGVEKMLEKSAESQKPNLKGNREKKGGEQGYDPIVERRYKEDNPFRRLSSPDSKATSQYNTLIESMERIYSENKRSELANSPREEEENNVKCHRSKAKSELPMHIISVKNVGFGDLNFRDQKIIDDMKSTFVFKAKKTMIDIVSPEEELHISREDKLLAQIQQRSASRNPSRGPSRGASRGGIREGSMENKLSNGKAPKLKLHHLVNKKPKETFSNFLLPEIQESLKAKFKSKEAISNIRDNNKLNNPLSRKNSNRDLYAKPDGPVFSIKIPKFKAILKAVGKNIESERFSPLLRPTEREMMSERPAQVQMLTKKPL